MDTSLAAAVQQMPTGVLIAEAPGGRVVLSNQRMAAIWRGDFPAAGAVADFADWRGFHTDGRAYRAEEWPLARAVLAGETVTGEEIEILRGDGTRGVVCMDATPIRDAAGRVTRAVATTSDVTEARRRERNRRFLGEATHLLARSLDYETTLRNVARLAVPAMADWCSVDILRASGEVERLAVQGEEGEGVVGPEPESAAIARVLATGVAELIPDADAAPEHDLAPGVRSAMFVPLAARERVLGVMVFLAAGSGRRFGPEDRDLAEELALRAGLAIDNAWLYHESQAASRAKSDFLAVISHELRTPLTAIIGYSELLALGVPDPLSDRQCEQVERIEVSAQHLMHLIEEILGLVSLEGGKTRLRTAEVGLAELVQRARAILGSMAAVKGLALEIHLPDPELRLRTDPDHLVQVMLNLLSNAIKFTDQGTVRLEAEPIGEELRIRVIDTGLGMTTEEQARIFDSFWQAEQPITRRAGGTGLGLTVTRRILELLGGRIAVRSEPGKGSTFEVHVPMREGAAAAAG